MMLAGEYGKSSQYAVDLSHREGWGGKRWTDPFVPAFDLLIHIVGNTTISTENNPGNSPDQACINAAMDIAAARELFRNLITKDQEVWIRCKGMAGGRVVELRKGRGKSIEIQ